MGGIVSVGDVRYMLVRRPWRKSCNSYVFDTFLLFTMHRGLNLNWDTVCVSQFMSFEFQSNKLKVGIFSLLLSVKIEKIVLWLFCNISVTFLWLFCNHSLAILWPFCYLSVLVSNTHNMWVYEKNKILNCRNWFICLSQTIDFLFHMIRTIAFLAERKGK